MSDEESNGEEEVKDILEQLLGALPPEIKKDLAMKLRERLRQAAWIRTGIPQEYIEDKVDTGMIASFAYIDLGIQVGLLAALEYVQNGEPPTQEWQYPDFKGTADEAAARKLKTDPQFAAKVQEQQRKYRQVGMLYPPKEGE